MEINRRDARGRGGVGTLSAPELLKFGTVKKGKEKQLPLELRNTHASQTLQVAVGTPSKGFSVVSGGGEFTLAPGAAHTVTLAFKSQKKGAKRGKLPLTTSDPARPTFEVGLKAKVR